MPYFDTEVHVDVDEFINACHTSDIEDLIDALINDGHLPKSVLSEKNNESIGKGEKVFGENLDKLKKVYYSVSVEDEQILEKIFRKYIF